MASLRSWLVFSRWYRAGLGLGLLAILVAACTLLVDRGKDQCASDSDCVGFGGHPYCQVGVCVKSGLKPDNCFPGTPSSPSEFANHCSTATCLEFNNCTELGLCKDTDQVPPPTPPPMPDAGPTTDASAIDALVPPVACVDGTRPVVVVGGSTAVQPFMSVVAPLLAPTQIVYQPSGSCTGVDEVWNPDPAKHVVKDIANRPALLFDTQGGSVPCTFGSPSTTTLDVAVSDVFASSCNAAFATMPPHIAEYLGPIQPMTFIVQSRSTQMSISAEKAHMVFGLGSSDPMMRAMPFVDPGLYFIRNASSGTQQMLARAIDVDARQWWGVDTGGSTAVLAQLKAVDPARAARAIGILSTDFADAQRQSLRIVAFQGKQQQCGYYPDSTVNTRDKINVRDGHYAIWGPVHFYTQVNDSGNPSATAGALVTRFSDPRLDKSLLDTIIKIGLVPACAMKVQRGAEMGAITAFSPPFQCGCYFEATVPDGKAPDGCQACSGPADCPSATPACNNGYCEVQ